MIGWLLLAGCGRPQEAAPRPAAVIETVPAPVSPGSPIKIIVDEPGMVEIPLDQLASWGLASEPERLRLSHRGEPQALWLIEEAVNRVIRFYAKESRSRYTAENIYWLQLDGHPAVWIEEPAAPPTAAEPVSQHLATLHLEENLRYSPKADGGEHFFWHILAAPGSQAFEFVLDGTVQGAGLVRIALWSSTEAPQQPDHQLRVLVNGQLVADEAWDGIGRQTIEADVPPGLLQDGANEVVLEAPGLEGVLADLNFVDWIEIAAPSALQAHDDRLWMDDISGGAARLTGFSGPAEVFDVTEPASVRRLPAANKGNGEVDFQAEPGRQYLAVGPGGYLQPRRIEPALTLPETARADYVAVGPAHLLEAAQPLLDWRAGNGLQVLSIPLQAIYDQFNHGFPEPDAIQALMQHAAQVWDPAPQYLLLLGDSSYDPRGYLAPAEANQLPTFLVSTVYGGETGSDVPFGQLDDDLWPEIAVGRIPARTPEQVATAVEKILAYEQAAPEGAWRQRVLAVADGQSPSFRHDAQTFLDQFGGDFQTDLFAPEAGAEGASQEVRGQIKAGSLLVAYFGHGSVTQWGKDSIFTTEDIAGLGNGDRLPVVVNMTCLTGLFTHPDLDSLAETLLWEPGGGAVAVLAPTSLTLPTDQSFLSAALVDALQNDPGATLGEISLAARREIAVDSPGGRDVMLTFLLFGDPALRLVSVGR